MSASSQATHSLVSDVRTHKFPVVEVFGPTVQGEGIDQGIPCYFIRMGGCDDKCTWCDTPFAVLPELVRRAERLTVEEICERINALAPGPSWIIISGGNPALHDLAGLVILLHGRGYKVAVETQGTILKPWLHRADRVCVSPKPPSSGNMTSWDTLRKFLDGLSIFKAFLKVVVLDNDDYKYARTIHSMFPGYKMFVSACNDAGSTVGNPDRVDDRTGTQIVMDLCARGRWLANRIMVDPEMSDVQVQVQNHVLYWANDRGH